MSQKRLPFTKERVKAWLERNFFLRLHMFFILSATFGSGLLTTKVLLAIGVHSLALRYALAVCFAYLAFLILIRIWLFYVNADRRAIDFSADGVNVIGDFSRAGASGDVPGGQFGGGGASGSWGKAPLPLKSGGGGGKSSFSLDLDLGGDEWVVILLFVALVLSLLVIGIYIIYTAPALLSETAFEAALAAALARRAKQIQRPGWMGVVWRATVWPFIIVLVLSVGLGWAAHRYCPGAKKLRDVWDCPGRRAG